MRTMFIFAGVCSLLAGSANRAWAQERGASPFAVPESFAREAKHAESLVKVYRSAGAFKAVEKDAATALEKIGSPAIFPLGKKLEEMWKEYWIANDLEQKHSYLTKVAKLAKLLGKFGVPLAGMGSYPEPDNPQKVVRDKVRLLLIEIAKVPNLEIEPRRAAIEALGKIHSQKAAYLLMNHPEILRSADNTKDLAKKLRKKAQDLKAKFVRDVPEKVLADQWHLKQQMLDLPDSNKIAEILLDARNLERYFHGRSNRKLLIFFSEMEPAGKEKSLKERTDFALAELENNLRIAVSGYDAQKKEPPPFRKDIESLKRDAWLKANRNAFDLCEDMEYMFNELISVRWGDELKQVHDVLEAFQSILEGESQFEIRLSVLQATRRMYAGED